MQNTQALKCAVLLIATNKYHQFVSPLLKGIEKNFLPFHKITVHLFNDREEGYESSVNGGRVDIKYHTIPSYKFPEATLLRYEIFTAHQEKLNSYDYLFYLDVDMAVAEEVGDEILSEGLTVVRHPGFFAEGRGWGSGNVHPESKAFISKEYWNKYFAGGFQGGKTEPYLEVCRALSENIADDERRGIRAEHNDESHLNAFLNKNIKDLYPEMVVNELDSRYCNVPSIQQRKAWGIDHLPGIILALDKNHAEIRS